MSVVQDLAFLPHSWVLWVFSFHPACSLALGSRRLPGGGGAQVSNSRLGSHAGALGVLSPGWVWAGSGAVLSDLSLTCNLTAVTGSPVHPHTSGPLLCVSTFCSPGPPTFCSPGLRSSWAMSARTSRCKLSSFPTNHPVNPGDPRRRVTVAFDVSAAPPVLLRKPLCGGVC